MEYSALILIHVAAGIVWGGGVLINGFFLIPAVLEAGPAGGTVMAALVRRHYSPYLVTAAVLALLSGLRLYQLRFSLAWLGTAEGAVLTLGGLLAISAWAIGLFRQKPLAAQMAQLAQQGRHDELPAVATRFVRYARLSAWHLVAVVLLMAGHRLAALF